ncbi:MAG: 4'-phosphopantetheinyl transferase superfamily protein [Desulfobacteraceae bacterium]|nr:4'-phosphopantetheinyl transferase superfamily protein [Desulfobacteraceae bacterium]
MSALSVNARVALNLSASKIGYSFHRFPKSDDGVPLPENGIYWSIAHKTEMVAAVASPAPVGIDIEKMGPYNEKIEVKIAGPDEWNLGRGMNRRLLFYRFWTAKEAVLKATGDGFKGISRCRIAGIVDDNRLNITYKEKLWPIVQFCHQDHIIAVTRGDERIIWTPVE